MKVTVVLSLLSLFITLSLSQSSSYENCYSTLTCSNSDEICCTTNGYYCVIASQCSSPSPSSSSGSYIGTYVVGGIVFIFLICGVMIASIVCTSKKTCSGLGYTSPMVRKTQSKTVHHTTTTVHEHHHTTVVQPGSPVYQPSYTPNVDYGYNNGEPPYDPNVNYAYNNGEPPYDPNYQYNNGEPPYDPNHKY
eukprot:TRINITY_DN7166_c0_g1_i2.p1 TRINITY_DN7166_c0_g1~~TRINITY_DN7166_c0_g1_i2.p1  ORF type:complete len:192 (+),score=26.11 TRINITY_DN7166_c0_g1_i2:2-577(+)